MPDWSELKGSAGSAAEQLFLWGILSQVVQALAGPAFTELQTTINEKFPVQPLSAADAATAANRSFLPVGEAAVMAAKSGISQADFDVLRHLAGNAPAPEELATALRRGIIDEAGSGPDAISFDQGIAEGNLLNKWGPVIQKLARQIPSPADVVNAIVRGQVSPADGAALFETVGGDPQYRQLLVNINGRPPAPVELLDLAKRGIIPWDGTGPQATTYQQGIYEGDSKDKWEPVLRHLADYYPTTGEVVELYRWGEIDHAKATGMLAERGLDAGQAAWWLGYADQNAVNDYRGLTEASALELLSAAYITDKQAETILTALHRGPAAIAELIEYAHVRRAISALTRAVSRIGTLRQSRKITTETARTALGTLGIPSAQVADILADWETVAAVNVKVLTEAQIADAFAAKIMTQAEAETELTNIGYTPYDAWVILSIKAKANLPGKPAQGPAAGLGVVPAGAT